jgi:hypothetical protein
LGKCPKIGETDEMSEWGYFSLEELRKITLLNIDYHFNETSIEAALYTAYTDHFYKPPSLEDFNSI